MIMRLCGAIRSWRRPARRSIHWGGPVQPTGPWRRTGGCVDTEPAGVVQQQDDALPQAAARSGEGGGVPAADGRSLSAQTREGNRAGFGQHGALGAWPAGRPALQRYYGDYCYLPLYIVVGDVVLWAQLRTSDHGGDEGVVPALEKIVAAIRQRMPRVRIIVRGDSGFGRDEIMTWCEGQRGYFTVWGCRKMQR